MNNKINGLNLLEFKVIVFDVDGTLYDQKKLRIKMFQKLISYYLLHPWMLKDLLILKEFRKQRELKADEGADDLANSQYKWVSKRMGLPIERVFRVIHRWIYCEPLKYLGKYKYPGLDILMDEIRKKGMLIVIFSDYPAIEKLRALKIPYDYAFCTTDKNIDRLKPDSKGLLMIMKACDVLPNECLFIGDRDDRDGECARRVGMPYIVIPKRIKKNYFPNLVRKDAFYE